MITSKLPESQYDQDFSSDDDKKAVGSKKKKAKPTADDLDEILEENENGPDINHSGDDSETGNKNVRKPHHRKPKVHANIFSSPS